MFSAFPVAIIRMEEGVVKILSFYPDDGLREAEKYFDIAVYFNSIHLAIYET